MTARSEGRAAVMLVVVTALWGVSFTWTKSWQEAAKPGPVGELLSALTVIGLRMPLALLLLGVWQPRVVLGPTRREHVGGVVLGVVFFVGFALQTWGLAFTTPALSGFFTSLCSAWAPLLGWVLLREQVAPLTLVGLVLALVGCALLVDGWKLNPGDWLTVAASVLFAFQILILDRLGKSMEAAHLTAGFTFATAVLAQLSAVVVAGVECGVGVWWGWMVGMLSRWDLLAGVVAQAVFASALAFHWMNTYQPLLSPSKAALIYLLEPIFASFFSILLGHEALTYPLVLGGLLIVVGNGIGALPMRRDKPMSVPAITDEGSG